MDASVIQTGLSHGLNAPAGIYLFGLNHLGRRAQNEKTCR
jgi:hypothetical protein